MVTKQTGAEKAQWDLGFFYRGVDDPRLDADVKRWVEMAKEFHSKFKGKLANKLGEALLVKTEMSMLGNKVGVYLQLRLALDTADEAAKSKNSDVEEMMNEAAGNYLEFFPQELVALSDETIEKLTKSDPVVAKHRPLIDQERVFKPHLLSEEVESALTKRAQFGKGAWHEFYAEADSDLRFDHDGKKINLQEMLHILQSSTSTQERAEVLKKINEGLGGYFGKLAAQTLNMVVLSKKVEDRERGFKHPMENRNKAGRIPDSVIEALHTAVTEHASPIAKRYYRLKAAHLKIEKLRWSDRNAPMPFADNSTLAWEKAVALVLSAYESFSPTLASIVRDAFEKKRVDAPAGAKEGRQGGAFNLSVCLPNAGPVSFTFMNYLGSPRDVMTLAHELGHGVHGILAGQAQGELMMHPSMAYAETASIFGEKVTFNYLKAELQKSGKKEALLALIMGKVDDLMNTVVRQMGFSNFERRVHAHNGTTLTRGETRRLSVEECDKIWLETTYELYGQPGEVFTYEDSEHLWAYIPHFHNPFYVHSYAFGALLTYSLYAKQDALGNNFEPLYLDMLRSGDTKDVVELLRPFGLDPTAPDFWKKGIEASIGTLMKEAEELSAQMGVTV